MLNEVNGIDKVLITIRFARFDRHVTRGYKNVTDSGWRAGPGVEMRVITIINSSITDKPTDRQTNKAMDGRTVKASCIVPRRQRLKRLEMKKPIHISGQ